MLAKNKVIIFFFFFLLKYSFTSSVEKNVLTQMVLIFFLKTWYDEQHYSLGNNASQGSAWSYSSFLFTESHFISSITKHCAVFQC